MVKVAKPDDALQLFLDDAKTKNFTCCFKDKHFLAFFMSRLGRNDIIPARYPAFPYLSLCGRERNFVRCADRPVVFTELLQKSDASYHLCCNHLGESHSVPFHPQFLSMNPHSGRVYYPGVREDLGIGLVKSSLAMELSKGFEFESGDESRPPTWFNWHGQRFELINQ